MACMSCGWILVLVIGVAARDFRFPRGTDLWTPDALPPAQYAEQSRFNEHLLVSARLKPGVTLDQANALLRVLSDNVKNNGTQGGGYAKASSWGMFALPWTDL